MDPARVILMACPPHHFRELSSFSVYYFECRWGQKRACLFCPTFLSFANNTELSLVRNFFLRQLLVNQLLRPEVVLWHRLRYPQVKATHRTVSKFSPRSNR